MDAQKDIGRVRAFFEAAGREIDFDQAAEILSHSLDILLERFDHPDADAIGGLYLGSLFANILPDEVRIIVKTFLVGDISNIEAQQRIAALKSEYERKAH